MASITLTGFFDPLGNTDAEIIGLLVATYPMTLDAGNSYTYPYGPYLLIYNPGTNLLQIWDGSPTVTYTLNNANGNWECTSDVYGRPSVLATYFTSASLTPPIYIRPVVTANTIRYNWEVSSILADSYILTCASTDGGSGGGTVTLSSNVGVYTYDSLTFGKTYECGIVGSNATTLGNSTFFRTVTTGNVPGTPIALSFVSTPTTLTLSWEAPAGVQTPTIGWYVITNQTTGAKYNTRYYNTSVTVPYDSNSYPYYVQSVSDTGYSPAPPPPPVTSLAGSLVFDGGPSTYLKLTPGVAMGAGSYTIECWFNNSADWNSSRGLLGGGPDGVTAAMSLFFVDGTTITTDSYGGLGQRSYTVNSISLNAWHHFVLVRNGSAIETVFIDGVKATGATGGTSVSGGQQVNNINYSGDTQNVGIYYGGRWTGYITNMRIVVGTAVYNPTGSTIIVPNTGPLDVVDAPNTKYLMLGADVTTDTSGTQVILNNSNNVTQSSSLKPF